MRDLDEVHGWGVDPDGVLDGSEDGAIVAASLHNGVSGGWGARGRPSPRDVWLTLAAAERAVDAATHRDEPAEAE